ncbi:response regulator [Primorskyibacter sp. 2E233]|uniref:response regulator n=1 Tax=Primorskyibacter sp. 2E233 TaxID=3413431 RepID=UPI003BF15AF0
MAKALGGELGAESEPGDGSVFWLRLPLAPPAGRARLEDSAETNVKARQSAIDPLNVLIVEDNAVNRLILRRMLESDGHHVTEAFDGVEGVETAEAKAFDIILMDISMPGMDGLTATRNIRNGGGPNAKTPMIATTAHALPDELEAFCRAGMCEALVKPISRDALRGVLHAAINEAAPDHIRVTPSSCSNVILDADHLRALQDSLSEDRFQATLHSFADEMNALLSPGAPMPDHDTLSLEAHRLAGSAGVVGAMQLTRRLQDIEWQSEVATPQTLDQLMDEARGCWRETRMALKDAGLLVDEMPTN